MHTAESINHVAKRLDDISAQLRVSAVLLEMEPVIGSVDVPREASRELGLERMSAWADSVRDAVTAARIAKARGVSDTPGQSDTAKDGARKRRKNAHP